jgi:hypothetical protein
MQLLRLLLCYLALFQVPYFLGVAHYWLPAGANKEGRSYHHFLIKVEAQPPFKVTQVIFSLCFALLDRACLAGSLICVCCSCQGSSQCHAWRMKHSQSKQSTQHACVTPYNLSSCPHPLLLLLPQRRLLLLLLPSL